MKPCCLLALLLSVACGPAEVPARAPASGELLIEELYYAGAAPAGGTDHYFADQFVELVNAGEAPLDVSGLLVGEVEGSAGEINPGMTPDSFAERRPDEVVLASIWRLPHGVRIEPGATLVLAHDGTNHRPFSTIDLSGAGFETYVADSGGDDDHPTVANLEPVLFNGGYDWLITVFGPSVVLIEPDTALGTLPAFPDLRSVPASAVIDGIDTLMDADSVAFKRLPSAVDAGFAYVGGPYVGQSLHRRRAGEGWQDTDDSAADFEVGAPDPGRPPPSDEVFGTPSVQLGTGQVAFEPLAAGDSVELVAGPQGGWHLDTTVWLQGFGPSGVRLVYEALDEQAQRVSFLTQAELGSSGVLEAAEGWHRVGDRVVLDITSADEVVDRELVLRVTAELGGQTWSDERVVRVVDDR